MDNTDVSMPSRFLTPLLTILACSTLAVAAPAPSADFDQVVLPFLQQHCESCHGPKKQKGELHLDTLPRTFSGPAAGHWMDVIDRISTGEMPPKKSQRPKPDDVAKVVEFLSARLADAEAQAHAAREPVNFYRLTREEYANTVYDLLGVHYDATDPTGLPEDANWRGFERIGSVLSLSPAHVEKYFAAAESSLSEALPTKPPAPWKLHWAAYDIRGVDKKTAEANGTLDKIRLDVWPGSTFMGQPGSVKSLDVPVTGQYTIRIKLSGMKPTDGRAPRVQFYLADVDRVLFEQDVVTEEDKPVTLEFSAHLPGGKHALRMTNEAPGPSNLPRSGRNDPRIPFYSIKQGRRPWQTKLTDEDGKPILPFLIVDWVEFEGPVISPAQQLAQQRYVPKETGDLAHARAILKDFATRAFRRPVNDAELDRFTGLVDAEMKLGEKSDAALKTGMLAVMCSKDFFYLVEGSADRKSTRVTDYELASRLSYFLWSTMPDDQLIAAAASSKLHQPDVLRAQLTRMIADPRIARFADAFPRQWLQLRRVGMFPPDKKLYPTYDTHLEKSMIGETLAYFRQVLDHNLSLREFLDSDWTMLNARLAEHYNFPGVATDQFVRVTLRPEDHRGGLLTQAAILSLTSDGTRHRPVHRGKWILESIIGKPPPPPPANVKPLEPTPETAPKATLRMKLMAHQSDPNCAGCHKRIDPLGMAFDNFDAIGRWRTEEIVRDGNGDNPKVDASGELIDGRTFTGPDDFRKLMLADIDKFNAAFVEKLATFALRRPMSMEDRAQLQSIAAQSKQSDYRLRAVIEAFVLSDLFQKR
jgi:mono/diheme cytochrome c family protein